MSDQIFSNGSLKLSGPNGSDCYEYIVVEAIVVGHKGNRIHVITDLDGYLLPYLTDVSQEQIYRGKYVMFVNQAVEAYRRDTGRPRGSLIPVYIHVGFVPRDAPDTETRIERFSQAVCKFTF